MSRGRRAFKRAGRVSAATFARRWRLSRDEVEELCRTGRIKGAEFDRTTWRWWIPYPTTVLR
jgi:hypothetical protein